MTHTRELETSGRRLGVPETVNEVFLEWSRDGIPENTGTLHCKSWPPWMAKTSKRSPKSLRYGEWQTGLSLAPWVAIMRHPKTSKNPGGLWTLVTQTGYLKEPKVSVKPVSWQLISSSHLQPKQVSPSLALWLVDSLKRVPIQGLESCQVSPWGT
jgi:hypothetical protein